MILSNDTKQKFKQAERMVLDGWSMTYALNASGLKIGNQHNIGIRKTEEYKNIYRLYMSLKYNKGDEHGFMG